MIPFSPWVRAWCRLSRASALGREAVAEMLTDGKSEETSEGPSVKPANNGSGFLLCPENPRLAAQARPGTSVGLWAGILRHPRLLQTGRMLPLVVIRFPVQSCIPA